MTFCFIQFRQNDVRANDVPGKRRSALLSFANSTIRPCDYSVKWLSAMFFFQQNNDSAKLYFGKTTIRWNDVSGRCCGPVDRFNENKPDVFIFPIEICKFLLISRPYRDWWGFILLRVVPRAWTKKAIHERTLWTEILQWNYIDYHVLYP